VSVAQEPVSEGLLKMVEVLGFFVTLLGFLRPWCSSAR
jgi:hypothetical protein